MALSYIPNASLIDSGWKLLYELASRITFIMPGILLTAFAARRHSQLFRLREHYAYKYSIAVSIEGFMKQSPKYAEDIAALAFEQIAFDPAESLTKTKEPKKEGRIFSMFLKKIEKDSTADRLNEFKKNITGTD